MQATPSGPVGSRDIDRPGYCQVCCGVYDNSWVGHPCPNMCREEFDPLRHPHPGTAYRERQVVYLVERGEVRDNVIAAWLLGGQSAACAVIKHWVRGTEYKDLTGL